MIQYTTSLGGDVVCDEIVVPLYERFGLQHFDAALGILNGSALTGEV